jgi:hypothetical protein
MKKYFATLLASLLLLTSPALAGSSQYPAKTNYDLSATIVIGTSTTVSPAVDLQGTQLVGIFIPATFDGTALTFTASDTLAGTYVAVDVDNTSATAYTVTTSASKYVPLMGTQVFQGLRYIKIVTSSAQTTTDTVFTLATRPTN